MRIAAGASQRPDRTPPETVFVIEVRATGRLRDADGAPLEVIPGMIAEVDILKGRKTVLDYLLRPVVRVKDRAFRD